jgi:hypothetical protein
VLADSPWPGPGPGESSRVRSSRPGALHTCRFRVMAAAVCHLTIGIMDHSAASAATTTPPNQPGGAWNGWDAARGGRWGVRAWARAPGPEGLGRFFAEAVPA